MFKGYPRYPQVKNFLQAFLLKMYQYRNKQTTHFETDLIWKR